MKKTADEEPDLVFEEDKRMKRKGKKKLEEEEDGEHEIGLGNLNDDLIFEVLKHLDVKTLATAACVNKKWSKMAEDDRLWEFICTRRWAPLGLSNRKFRSFVLDDSGGFRRFYSTILSAATTLSKKQTSSSSSIASRTRTAIVQPKVINEVILLMYVICIRCYEMMNLSSNNRNSDNKKRKRRINCKT
ncbi:hypothetical protein MKX03_003200 [Papaver bracteatum]|nr:hypothetical protein MKX03_003200 [Papaver bracteatum]